MKENKNPKPSDQLLDDSKNNPQRKQSHNDLMSNKPGFSQPGFKSKIEHNRFTNAKSSRIKGIFV